MSALSVLLGILITKIKHRNIFHIIIKHFDFQLLSLTLVHNKDLIMLAFSEI